MNIHIKWGSDKHSIQLPIVPESFEVSDSMNNTSVVVHNLGEINLKGKRNLKEVSLSSFFPAQKYAFAKTSYHAPYNYVRVLKRLFERNETIHLIITGTNINGFYTIESFNYGHADKTKDVSYTLGMKEYRETATTSRRHTKTASSTVHTWKKGDTWQKLTKKTLGSSKEWKSVRKRNLDVIKKAKKKYPKKKEADALTGYKVVIKA